MTPDFVETRTADGDAIKIRNKSDIANVMNRQFSQMGAKLAEKLDPATTHFSDYLQFPNPNTDCISFEPITETEVAELIYDLDDSKSVGIDQIPPKLLKWGAPVLVPIFTAIFNKCLIKGVYPDSLKVARVTPVFKGGNKNSTTSYRPISILTQLNRVLEKILCDRLYTFMKPKLYLYLYFKPFCS